jgi:subtilase family serine protease
MKVTSFAGVGVALTLALGAQSALAALPPVVKAAPAAAQAAAATDTVEFTVYLPLRNEQQLEDLLTQLHDSKSPNYQQWLQPADFLNRFGPTAADLATVRKSLVAHGFTVISDNAHGIRVQGPASAVSKAFAVPVQTRTQNAHTRFMAKGSIQLPNELAALNARIIGLEGVPEHQVHSRLTGPVTDTPVNRYSPYGDYWFDDLKQAYDYPAYAHKKTDGTGVSAAVVMSDLLYPGDLAAAFNHELFSSVTGVPVPAVTTVTVDGGGIVGGNGTLEASLDVQQILGGAPGASVTLVSLPDLSDDHILDGYAYVIDKNSYDLVNSSFGECELEYTAAYNQGTDFTYILKQYHELFAQGSAQGITFVASSGDSGALLCPSPDYGFGDLNPTFGVGVSTPADDPDVTAVGGGNLITTYKAGSLNSAYVRESAFADPEIPYDVFGVGVNVSGGVWGAGGGISEIYKKPLYQYLANTGSATQRTLPDVGMEVGGCPAGISASCGADDTAVVVAYGVNYGGGFFGVIGTSVSSPEFLGALALFEEKLGPRHRQGIVNYYLYAQGALQTLLGGDKAPPALQFYHRNIPGFDGYYNAGKPSYNYDYIYGNGSPDVRKLFGLEEVPAAGVPQTPSNP